MQSFLKLYLLQRNRVDMCKIKAAEEVDALSAARKETVAGLDAAAEVDFKAEALDKELDAVATKTFAESAAKAKAEADQDALVALDKQLEAAAAKFFAVSAQTVN
jgi:hypothetical protein